MIPENLRKKIKKHKELSDEIKKHKAENKKIVHCHGVFDLIHPGHIHQFNQAKQIGDILVVSLVDDHFVKKGLGRPFFPQEIRLDWIASLELVDYVALCDSEGPWKVMEAIKPHFFIKGKDTEHLLNNPSSGLSKDKILIESLGGKLHFTDSLPFHSTEILKKFFNTHPKEVKNIISNKSSTKKKK